MGYINIFINNKYYIISKYFINNSIYVYIYYIFIDTKDLAKQNSENLCRYYGLYY